MSRSGHSDIGCLIRFIPAGSKTVSDVSTQQLAACKGTLSGEEAKAFYEEVLQEECSNKQDEKNDCKGKAKKRKVSKTCETGACKNELSRDISDPDTNLTQELQGVIFEPSAEGSGLRQTQKSAVVQSWKSEQGNVSKCPQPNENKLLCFAQNGNISQLTKLLKNDPEVDIDHSDQFGWTALMCAVVGRHKDIVHHLLAKGANRMLKNRQGKSAVELAKNIGANDIVKVLSQSLERTTQSTPVRQKHTNFYCEVCKSTFSESTEKEHISSTVHLFNLKLKPKPDPFTIPESNIGYRLMRSSGWDGEKGLGPEGKGNKFPVKTVLKTDRLCLGSEQSKRKKAKITHFGPNDADAVKIDHKHTLNRVLSARASSRKERRRREQKERRWEKNLRQYWDIDCESVDLEKM